MLPPSTTYSRAAVACAVTGLALTGLFAFAFGARTAGYWLAIVVGGFGVARAVLPPRRVAPFAIRERWVDVVLMVGASVLLAAATSVAPF